MLLWQMVWKQMICVSIWAAEAREEDRPYFVVGIDKDLLQIPGKHYNFAKRTHTSVNMIQLT